MLDISFYSTNGYAPTVVDVSEPFYQWLLQSDFSEIGIAHPHKVTMDTDEVLVDVVDLNKGSVSNRHRFREFLVEVIVQEADAMLISMKDKPASRECKEQVYRLGKLQELRKCIENENYRFLQNGIY